MDDPIDVGVRFVAQMLGLEIVDGPPDPDTPLGRVRALTTALEELDLPGSVVDAAVMAMWREEWRAQGLDSP